MAMMAGQAFLPIGMQMHQSSEMQKAQEINANKQEEARLKTLGAGTISCPGFEEKYPREIPEEYTKYLQSLKSAATTNREGIAVAQTNLYATPQIQSAKSTTDIKSEFKVS